MLRLHAMKEAVTSREGAILAREATLSTTLLNLAPLNSTRLKVTLLVNSNLVNVTLDSGLPLLGCPGGEFHAAERHPSGLHHPGGGP